MNRKTRSEPSATDYLRQAVILSLGVNITLVAEENFQAKVGNGDVDVACTHPAGPAVVRPLQQIH